MLERNRFSCFFGLFYFKKIITNYFFVFLFLILHRNSNACNVATKAGHFTHSVLLCVFNFDAALTSSLFPLLYSFCSFGNVTDIHFPFFVIRHFPAELVLEIFLK